MSVTSSFIRVLESKVFADAPSFKLELAIRMPSFPMKTAIPNFVMCEVLSTIAYIHWTTLQQNCEQDLAFCNKILNLTMLLQEHLIDIKNLPVGEFLQAFVKSSSRSMHRKICDPFIVAIDKEQRRVKG